MLYLGGPSPGDRFQYTLRLWKWTLSKGPQVLSPLMCLLRLGPLRCHVSITGNGVGRAETKIWDQLRSRKQTSLTISEHNLSAQEVYCEKSEGSMNLWKLCDSFICLAQHATCSTPALKNATFFTEAANAHFDLRKFPQRAPSRSVVHKAPARSRKKNSGQKTQPLEGRQKPLYVRVAQTFIRKPEGNPCKTWGKPKPLEGNPKETLAKREGNLNPERETRRKPLQNVRETQTFRRKPEGNPCKTWGKPKPLEGNPRETLAKREGNLNPERETRRKPLQNVRETQTFRRKPEGNPCKTWGKLKPWKGNPKETPAKREGNPNL